MSVLDKIFIFILVLSHVDRILTTASFEVVDHRRILLDRIDVPAGADGVNVCYYYLAKILFSTAILNIPFSTKAKSASKVHAERKARS
jgi:hypothetical protein